MEKSNLFSENRIVYPIRGSFGAIFFDLLGVLMGFGIAVICFAATAYFSDSAWAILSGLIGIIFLGMIFWAPVSTAYDVKNKIPEIREISEQLDKDDRIRWWSSLDILLFERIL